MDLVGHPRVTRDTTRLSKDKWVINGSTHL
jgi:hypothetical protein